LFQDGDVRIGVFPKGEEILVGGASLGRVALECIGAGEGTERKIQHDPALVDDLLELRRRFLTMVPQ
jgi:hypothetical protein